MNKYRTKGFISGISSAVSYGMNPLFALPMYASGMGVSSVLFYRYLFAIIIYWVWLKFFKKTSLRINLKEALCLFFLAITFSLSSLFLFNSFKYINSGIACTILFVYPTIVAILSSLFFKEKITKTFIFAIFLTSLGIILLYGTPTGNLNMTGVISVLISAFSYAIYIIAVKNIKTVKHIKYDKLSFYVMLFGLSVYIVDLKFCTQLQTIPNLKILLCALELAILPTIISLETINFAIRIIGPTTTAILGALEPLTAIFFGLIFFHEILTLKMIFGIFLILFGVILVILRNNKRK